jgi:hypothetical protein
MFNIIFRSLPSCVAIAGAVLVGPIAMAATPSGMDGASSAVRSLDLQGNELAVSTLGNIRGGFELTPNLTINFGFSQIDSLGKNIIQSIIVPITTLTGAHTNATAQISGSGGSTTAQLQAYGGISTPSTPVTPVTTTVGTNATSTSTLQATPSTLSLTSTANQGQTTFLTQLAGSGITNMVQNQANAQLIQQATTITIGISGLSQWLSAQRGNMPMGNGFSAP